MPYQANIGRARRIATKEVMHGDPAVELGTPGTAAKSTQSQPGVPNAANAEVARTILEDEGFVIFHAGIVSVRTDLLPAGAEEGDPLYITEADNSLADAAEALTAGVLEAGFVKFGRVEGEDASSADHTLVNLDLRDTF
jgi:hypothetical protein